MEVGVLHQLAHVRFGILHTIVTLYKWRDFMHANPYIAVPCGDPPTIPNGSRTFTGTKFRGTATYICDDGYQRSGSATVTCQASGSWSTRPTCKGVFRLKEVVPLYNFFFLLQQSVLLSLL